MKDSTTSLWSLKPGKKAPAKTTMSRNNSLHSYRWTNQIYQTTRINTSSTLWVSTISIIKAFKTLYPIIRSIASIPPSRISHRIIIIWWLITVRARISFSSFLCSISIASRWCRRCRSTQMSMAICITWSKCRCRRICEVIPAALQRRRAERPKASSNSNIITMNQLRVNKEMNQIQEAKKVSQRMYRSKPSNKTLWYQPTTTPRACTNWSKSWSARSSSSSIKTQNQRVTHTQAKWSSKRSFLSNKPNISTKWGSSTTPDYPATFLTAQLLYREIRDNRLYSPILPMFKRQIALHWKLDSGK